MCNGVDKNTWHSLGGSGLLDGDIDRHKSRDISPFSFSVDSNYVLHS